MNNYFLGIDPGKQGAFVIIDQSSNILEKIPTPLLGKDYDKKTIRDILCSREFMGVGLENVGIIFGVSKSAVASLSHCVGLFEGMLMGLGIRHKMVRPKEWQKECWLGVEKQYKPGTKRKTVDTKATSILAAINKWPDEDFKITNKGGRSKNYNDGLIDAALIAEYVRLKFIVK